MLRTEYIRNLNCNYERIALEHKPEEKKYQYCILGRGGIKGLLPCSLRYINGVAYLYYDISSRQNVKQLYSARGITGQWLKDFMWGMKQVRQELERFLLDYHNIIWYPDQVFQDLESNIFSFIYIPYYEGEETFGDFLAFLAEHIDYADEALVECVYHMFEQYEKNGEVYLQTQIFEDAKKLEEISKLADRQPDSETKEFLPSEEHRQATGREEQETDDGIIQEERRGIFKFFDRKKKSKERRGEYLQDTYQEMPICAVAEETVYGTEDYGQTIYMEVKGDEQGKVWGIYLPDGKLLSNLDKTAITIGKKKEEADVVLEDSSISRIHARIVKEGEYYYLEDLNSTNGTFKNGLRLQPYEKRRLEEGDDIRCGKVLFVFK